MASVTVITASLPERAPLLKEAIASVAAQTVPVYHLVMVDATKSVAEVRNILVEAASSEWVLMLDDDDWLDPECVETLLANTVDTLDGTQYDVVIPHCRFDGNPLPDGYYNREFTRKDLRSHGVFPITALARRHAVLDAGGFPLDAQYEDWQLWNNMADRGRTFRVVPIKLWTYFTGNRDRRTHRIQGLI